MAEILLTSEKFVKSVSNISDNVAGKYLQPSIKEAQDIGLKGILGDALLRKLKDLVKSGEITAEQNTMYKDLLDRSQYYLAFTAIVSLTNMVSYKVGNFGVSKSNDENLQVASHDEIVKQQYYYQAKADAFCNELQSWVLENKSSFKELSEAHCKKLHATLHSAASCGIFLGGARGKRVRR